MPGNCNAAASSEGLTHYLARLPPLPHGMISTRHALVAQGISVSLCKALAIAVMNALAQAWHRQALGFCTTAAHAMLQCVPLYLQSRKALHSSAAEHTYLLKYYSIQSSYRRV